jgi:shikimate kinase
MNPAANLILVGPMGAGKSTIGRRLAKRFDLQLIDLDRLIEANTGARIPLIFELEGEAGFREREHAALAQVCSGEGLLIATGGGAVLRADNRELMRRSGFVVWLRTDVARQLQRLRADGSRPLLMAPDREQRLTEMAAQRNPLYREVADLIFESAQAHVGVASDRLARVLQRRWQPLHPATPSTSSTSGPPSP